MFACSLSHRYKPPVHMFHFKRLQSSQIRPWFLSLPRLSSFQRSRDVCGRAAVQTGDLQDVTGAKFIEKGEKATEHLLSDTDDPLERFLIHCRTHTHRGCQHALKGALTERHQHFLIKVNLPDGLRDRTAPVLLPICGGDGLKSWAYVHKKIPWTTLLL